MNYQSLDKSTKTRLLFELKSIGWGKKKPCITARLFNIE